MESTINSLLSVLEFVPLGVFSFVPIGIGILFAIAGGLLAHFKQSYAGNYYLHMFVTAVRLGVTAFLLTSVMLFTYILFQPLRRENNRWLEGVEWVSMPQVDEIGRSDGIASGAVNPLIDKFNEVGGNINQLSDQTEKYENLRRGFTHTFAEALIPYGGYIVLGVILLILIRLVFGGLRRRVRELEHYIMNVETWRQGWETSESSTYYPYDRNFNYIKHGYNRYCTLMDRK